MGLTIGMMYYARCIHPPGGATALTAVVGGAGVHKMGYGYVLAPVAMNCAVMLATAVAFNYPLAWRRYPAALVRRNPMPRSGVLTHEHLSYALGRMGSMIDVSEAEALTRSARAYLVETIEAAWAAASRDGVISVEHRRDLRLATTHAVRAAARAVDLMYTLGGGTSVYKTSALQRHFRDVHVATQHMMVSEATYELTGRLFLGVPTNTAML